MMIKPTSKTLRRSYNAENGVYSLFYHATAVVVLDTTKSVLTLNTDGWNTANTARAMNIALSELNIQNVNVRYTKSKKTNGIPTLFINVNGVEKELNHGDAINLDNCSFIF